ncbi:DNA-directed RNA polymerase subunit alpha [Candidatus Kaiserbacteria bacterium CG10_big_fil_rev_8_21_14_0_10_43_70]|uniref:DNA-directed RNA polymerase subunit alpha n=1 Tax=Candidatus Kaiserbacteria bacterium CG10_big_fil_rev_8_21_14_0_10_43_70 TaxID=1974605 RepID=A0A2H0UIL9_9BACT|nr:MAG: DNA-directed RNA polymerase subunit alpha [Candidatus Kaiserbacteria bacterium CG10_big_fil_rev_8_21_14_0_10_43_70]
MSDNQITLPSKPRVVSEKEFSGTYEIDGLYPGYGHTLGNSIRRIILSSLSGSAITHIKIEGIDHEFSTIEGVKEDVVTLILNLRKTRIKVLTEDTQTLKLKVKGPKVITAGDIDAPGQVEILNPDQYIAEITGKIELDIEMSAQRGLGYVPKEVIQKDRVEIGTIPLDAIFSPIRRVNYDVENMRVGDRTDFNRLRIFIETDGTLTAREALEKSIEIMIHQLKAIVGFKEEEDPATATEVTPEDVESEAPETPKPDSEILKTRITELSLSPRVEAALDGVSIRTVGGLVRKREEDLLVIEGLGQKGLQEIKRALSNFGLTLRS